MTATVCRQEPREAEESQRGSDRTYPRWQVQTRHEPIDVFVLVVLDLGTGLKDVIRMAHTVIPPPRCTVATLELTHKGNIKTRSSQREIGKLEISTRSARNAGVCALFFCEKKKFLFKKPFCMFRGPNRASCSLIRGRTGRAFKHGLQVRHGLPEH